MLVRFLHGSHCIYIKPYCSGLLVFQGLSEGEDLGIFKGKNLLSTDMCVCVCVFSSLQAEIVKRLNGICAQVLPYLSQEVQKEIAAVPEHYVS